MSFFWSHSEVVVLFFSKRRTHNTKGSYYFFFFFESVLSNTKETNQIAHPFYSSSKPSSKTPRTIIPLLKEDEDGTQTLLETVRVLHHRALPDEFFRVCTGTLRRLRAARVLDRHRRLEIRELARMVRRRETWPLFLFFFSRCCFSDTSLPLPFFVRRWFYG